MNIKDLDGFNVYFTSERKQKGCVLMIGNFDGFHLGHQELVKKSKQLAAQSGLPTVLLTFDPHPFQFFRPQDYKGKLFSTEDQVEQCEKFKIDCLYVQKFDSEFSQITDIDFFEQIVVGRFNARHLVVGHDFKFGKQRTGDVGKLSGFCSNYKIGFTVIPAISHRGEIVSTTLIKNKLIEGNLEAANELLGRSFYLQGEVTHGARRGHSIGVPTMNLKSIGAEHLKRGVYFTRMLHAGVWYTSISNVGLRPTFNDSDLEVRSETHVFGFYQDIYGKKIKVEFDHFLRDEKKFQNMEVLKIQIGEDLKAAKEYFKI